jgi:Protein of unknown function (DUF3027)
MPAATLPTPAKRPRAARPKVDAVLVDAVDVALSAAREAAEHPGDVGEHLAATMDADRLASHTFACTMRGYRGWHWTVTVARAPRSKTVTVCEVELLPGAEAILAPEWLPWSERLRPGDIGPGDVLPFRADDPRLVPGYTPTGDEEEDRVAIEELALARARVLSPEGRDEAAQRWYAGSRGPTTPGSVQAASDCGSCGFLVLLQGSLGQVFGVCANEWSEDDGRVVSLDHGCGAHSETDVEPHPTDWPDDAPVIDEMTVEIVDLGAKPAAASDATVVEAASQAEPVVDAESQAEPAVETELQAEPAVAHEGGTGRTEMTLDDSVQETSSVDTAAAGTTDDETTDDETTDDETTEDATSEGDSTVTGTTGTVEGQDSASQGSVADA